MTITVGPTERNTHHVSFTDVDGYEIGLLAAVASNSGDIDKDIKHLNRSPIDRTAIKTSSGDTEYSDFRPPYYALKQDDWSGGRGQDDWTKDQTRFFDSGGLNTKRGGYVHLNGQEQLSNLLRAGGQHQPGNMAEPSIPSPSSTGWCTKVIPDTTTTYNQIWIWHHSSDAMTVELYNGADAAFATKLTTDPTTLTTTPPSFAPGWHVVTLDTAININNSDGVWVSLPLTGGTTTYSPDDAISGFLLQSGSPVASDGFPCRVVVQKEPTFGRFFKLWERLYYLQIIDGATHVWYNGYAGVLTTGGTLTVTDTNQSFTTNELAGAVFQIRGGTGFSEHQRWRKIASNTGTTITFESAFETTLDGTTFYCILGTDVWTEIASGTHGLSGFVHDILECNEGVVYFAQGSAYALRKMREDSTDGSNDFADDAGAPAPRYMTQVGNQIWGVENTDATQARSATTAATPTLAWSGTLTWGSAIACGDRFSPFTGITTYNDGAGNRVPFVFKEGEFGPIVNSSYNNIQLDEYKKLASARNGRANLVHDTNLYFSFGNGLERWYYPNLDDVGPNREEGFPENRAGEISCLAGYPGRFYAGVDAGLDGYSCVMSPAWHEEWRGAYGMRVLDVLPQSIPGDALDRLWIAAGGDILWVPMPSDTTNPLNDSNMLYTAGGYVETSSYYTELKTALKYVALVKFIFKDILDEQYSQVEYSLDEGTTWSDLDDAANPTTDDDATIKYNLTNVVSSTPYYGLTGYSVRLRIKLFTTDKTVTPVLRAMVMEGLARTDNKYAYTIPFVLEGTATDPAHDLLGSNDLDSNDAVTTADGKLATLIDWADGGPLYMKSMDARFDDKMVLMLPFAESLVEYKSAEGARVYVGQLTVQDA